MTDKLTFTINIYDEDAIRPNILDQGFAQMTQDEADNLVDIALEIAMRIKNDMPYEEFLTLLVSNCEEADLI